MAANITKINIYGLKKMIAQKRNYENFLEKKVRAHGISQMENEKPRKYKLKTQKRSGETKCYSIQQNSRLTSQSRIQKVETDCV